LKRTGIIFILAALIFLGSGCASSGKAALLAQKDPIALVSVVSNEDINWQEDPPQDPDNLSSAIRRMMRSDPDLAVVTKADELINEAESIFREAMSASRHFVLADRERVLQSRSYLNAKEKKYPNRNMVKAENYRFIDYGDKNFSAALADETGIQRSMFVEFNFSKFVYSGFSLSGNIKAEVEMTVIVVDARGKTIYRKTSTVPSLAVTQTTSGLYSQSELKGLFWEAIANSCFEFFDQFEY